MNPCRWVIEHSGNEIIARSGLFEGGIGPRALRFGVRRTRVLEECEGRGPLWTGCVSILSLLYEIFADCIFVEHWAGALRVQPRFWDAS